MSSTKILIFFLLTGLLYGLGTLGLSAHDWYSPACCSTNDCTPIASCSEIVEGAKGTATWGKYFFEASQVHPSQDSRCHVCIHDYGDMLKPMCVYIQQGS